MKLIGINSLSKCKFKEGNIVKFPISTYYRCYDNKFVEWNINEYEAKIKYINKEIKYYKKTNTICNVIMSTINGSYSSSYFIVSIDDLNKGKLIK